MENENMTPYEKEYIDFWKDLVENPDGTLNKDKVMRELADFSMVMSNCSRAYAVMTCGRVSKANTYFNVVEEIFNENFIDANSFDIHGCREDLETILNDCVSYGELREEIQKYFL